MIATINGRRLLTANDLAAQLQVGRSTLYRWMNEGRDMPTPVRLGRSVRWTQESVDAWLARNTAGDQDAA